LIDWLKVNEEEQSTSGSRYIISNNCRSLASNHVPLEN